MNKQWLFLDCHFMAHRLRFSMGDLSFQGEPSAVSFGFLRDLILLQNKFNTQNIAFCFDSKKSLREGIFSGYKAKRKEKYKDYNQEELAELGAFRHQIKELRKVILPNLGYKNIFMFTGFEADDILARCCEALQGTDEGVIVGSDKDLYQLLSPRVVMYKLSQKKVYSEKDLAKEFCGISPSQWHVVKAMSGCNTDDIPGISGVGEKTAAKFLKSILNEKSLTYKRVKEGEEIWRRNVKLTKLPYPDTPKVELVQSNITTQNWRNVLKKYGMLSLMDRI